MALVWSLLENNCGNVCYFVTYLKKRQAGFAVGSIASSKPAFDSTLLSCTHISIYIPFIRLADTFVQSALEMRNTTQSDS